MQGNLTRLYAERRMCGLSAVAIVAFVSLALAADDNVERICIEEAIEQGESVCVEYLTEDYIRRQAAKAKALARFAACVDSPTITMLSNSTYLVRCREGSTFRHNYALGSDRRAGPRNAHIHTIAGGLCYEPCRKAHPIPSIEAQLRKE